jgi:hypothetical protein
LISLASGEDFLWRPVLAGLCSYRDVSESQVDLYDVATMNELLDVKTANDRRVQEAEAKARRQRHPENPFPF